MHNNLKGLRAVPLYRVSTKKQMGTSGDLWDQKNIVQKFIYENEMNIVREFVECVSGFKNKAEDREALLKIREMANGKEFDVLVIYHSNRFGRRQDMTSMITELYTLGIQVISTLEGELKANTPTEVSLNDVRFFNNRQESIIKQHVIADYHLSMVENGRFRGGDVPYGYQLIDFGTVNFKGRPIYDLEILNEEAEIVKAIYHLSTNMNFGARKIATYLNENKEIYPTRAGGPWYYSTINYILNNTMYKGQYHMKSRLKNKEILSIVQDDLIIIPSDRWEENQAAIRRRKTTKSKASVAEARNANLQNEADALLGGLVYCGHCGSRLSAGAKNKYYRRKDGTISKTRTCKYSCSSNYARGGVKCDGQTTYGVMKIDTAVIEQTKKFILRLVDRKLNDSFMYLMENQIAKLKKSRETIREELEESYRMHIAEDRIKELNRKLVDIEVDIVAAERDKNGYIQLEDAITDWGKKFDNCSTEEKRSMLSKVIDRVEILKDNIVIHYEKNLKTYLENSKKHTEIN